MMIMNYRPNKSRLSNLTKWLSPVVVIGLLYLLTLTPALHLAERLVIAVARPLWKTPVVLSQSVVGVTATSLVKSKKVLIEENRQLQVRISGLENQLLSIATTQRELEQLRTIFGRPNLSQPKALSLVLA